MEEVDEYTEEMFSELMRSGIVVKSIVLIGLVVLFALYTIEMLWISLVAVILLVVWMYVIVPYMATWSRRREYGRRKPPRGLAFGPKFFNDYSEPYRGFFWFPSAEVPAPIRGKLSPLDKAALGHKFINYSRKPAIKPKRKPSTSEWGSLAKPPVTIDNNPTGWEREDLEIKVGREEGRTSYNRTPIFSTGRLKDKQLRERILDQRISGLCDYYSVNHGQSDSSDYTSPSGASRNTFVSLPKDNRRSVKSVPRRPSQPATGHVKRMMAQYK
jgi:hypothetical protein